MEHALYKTIFITLPNLSCFLKKNIRISYVYTWYSGKKNVFLTFPKMYGRYLQYNINLFNLMVKISWISAWYINFHPFYADNDLSILNLRKFILLYHLFVRSEHSIFMLRYLAMLTCDMVFKQLQCL